jgi:ribonuclease P protein component
MNFPLNNFASSETLKYSKNSRILKKSDFLLLKEKSIRVKGRFITLYFRNRSGDIQPSVGMLTRIGISVSKRAGNSVERSRYKRLLKEAFRNSHFRNLGIDCLFVVNYSKHTRSEPKLIFTSHLSSRICLDVNYLLGKATYIDKKVVS